MVVTRHPRVETLGYYWSRICAPGGRVFVSGLKSARGRASIDLVIEISFFDAPQARGTGAPSPRTSVRLPTRAPTAYHFCPNHSPGLEGGLACGPVIKKSSRTLVLGGLVCRPQGPGIKKGGRKAAFFYCLDKRLRSCSCRRILRRRMDLGVTSTYSSPWMYSRASSRLKVMGVTMRTLSSEPEARMLVSFLLLVTLITRSPSRLFSPIT